MNVAFAFTDSPPGSLAIRLLTGVFYTVYDHEGTLILSGEGGIHELAPDNYCINAQKGKDDQNIYWAQQTFQVPTEIPETLGQIIPPPLWDLQITVYMKLIPLSEIEEVPCPEMYPQEDSGSLLWLGIVILLFMGAG